MDIIKSGMMGTKNHKLYNIRQVQLQGKEEFHKLLYKHSEDNLDQ